MATTPKAEPLVGPYSRSIERFPMVRQSLLSTFDSCGLSARFESDYRHGWSTHPQARGSIFHRVAAMCLRTMSQHKEESIPVDAALAHLHAALRQDDVDRVCPACKGRKIRPGIKDGMRTCGSCRHRFQTELMNLPMREVKDLYWIVIKWANENVWSIENLVAVEERLHAKVSYPDPEGGFVERIVTGQLDALFTEGPRDDHAIVLDWKDTWGMPGPTEVSFEGYFQQRFYAMLVMQTYRSIDKVTLREFYVRYSEPREVTIWRDELDAVEQEFGALVERFDRAVHENAFMPTPGNHCSWCIRPGACPILPEARAEGRIRTAAEAERIARQLIVADAVVGQTRGALQTYASTHGSIPVRDAKGKRVLGYRETTRTERPTREKLEQAIREAGDVESLNVDGLFRTTKGSRWEQFVPKREVVEDDDAAILAALEGSLAEAQARQDRRA